MKILFFSDIHGNLFAFNSFLKDIENKEVDLIIFGGDFFGYYYYQNEIISEIRKRGIPCVLGNHDKMYLDLEKGEIHEEELVKRYGSTYSNIQDKITEENKEFLRKIPIGLEFLCDGKCIGVFHGSPIDPINGRIYPDAKDEDIIIYKKFDYLLLGHTHHKMIRQKEKTIIINPGSLGQQRDGKGCSYIILDTLNEKIEFFTVEYNVNKLIELVDEWDLGNERLKEVLTRGQKHID